MGSGELIEVDFRTGERSESDLERGARAVAALERAIHERRDQAEIEGLRYQAETAISRVGLSEFSAMYRRASEIQDEQMKELR